MIEAPVYECISADELVALGSGDVEVERLEELLDHVDDCAECRSALRVVVVLKAHREEAIELLERARNWKEGRPCSGL